MGIKVVFMGTPEFSVPILEGLIENYKVVGVVTQPDKEVGRNHKITYSPVKECAIEHNIKVLQPLKVRKEYEEIIELKPDIIVTCAYGQIIPKALLDYPKYGCINVHASLLPKLRGGAPLHRAIINGESKTGITIMYMDEHMDTGDMISKEEILIDFHDTVGEIHDKLSLLGRDLLLQTMPDIIQNKVKPVKQNDEEATYAPIIKREDELIDFNKKSLEIYNQIRGLNPYPVAYAMLDGKVMKIYSSMIKDNIYTSKQNGEIVRIYDDGIGVSTSDSEIILKEIKPEGKRKMSAKEYLNGVDKDSLIGKIFNKE